VLGASLSTVSAEVYAIAAAALSNCEALCSNEHLKHTLKQYG